MNAPRYFRRVAMAGAVLAALIAPRAAGLAIAALMLAPALIVPLGLSLAVANHQKAAATSDDARAPLQKLLVRALMIFAPIGGAAAALGWLLPPGETLAIVAAAVHGVTCALAALFGLTRLYARRSDRWRGIPFAPLHEFAIDVGLLLVPVGATWLFASRARIPLAGFHEPVITFTAAHFHYAGFAAPIVIGAAGRLLFDDPKSTATTPAGPRTLYRVAASVVCAGIPLTALGILTNHSVEAPAAVFLACGMLCACVVLVFYASRRAYAISRAAAVLYVVSGLVLLLTMSLAMTFALTSSAGRGSDLHGGVITIQTMIDLHGAVNAFGFALSGLVAHAMVASNKERSSE